MMHPKRMNVLLILTSLAGYLEWGGGNHIFLFRAEAEVLSKLFTDPVSVVHPLTILPMAAQLLLLITLFQKTPGRVLTYLGIGGLGLLLLFVLLAGLLGANPKMVLSVLPFLATAFFTIRYFRKAARAASPDRVSATE